MDFDPRDDCLGPTKGARTDSFPLKVQGSANGSLSLLVRSNSILSDGRLACSPTSLSASDRTLLADSAFMAEGGRSTRSESSVIPYSALSAATRNEQQPHPNHQASPQFTMRNSGLPLSMGVLYGLHESERGVEQGVFTASQLRELQHQALIYKFIISGVSVPLELVYPIRASVAALAAGLAPGHYQSSWWGNYHHLGYANSMDPEPGRCRRTDGKKWRCSRDVVPDQKYCERHMHRGRHRSRKAVENNSATTTAANNSPTGTASSGDIISSGSLQLAASSVQPSSIISPSSIDDGVATRAFGTPFPLSNSCFRSSSDVLSVPLRQPTEGLSIGHLNEFGCLHGDLSQEQPLFSDNAGSLRGLSQESHALSGLSVLSSAMNNSLQAIQHSKCFLGAAVVGGSDQAGRDSDQSICQPLRHFFDDWPRGNRGSSLGPWSEVDDDGSNTRSSSTTQLSISIPAIDFISSTNGSSPHAKLALSPLKLSMSQNAEDDLLGVECAAQTGLGKALSNDSHIYQRSFRNDGTQQQQHSCGNSWIPVAWESSVGGPLAEVLQSSNNTPRGRSSSGLNLLTDGWEASPRDSAGHMQTSSPEPGRSALFR